MGSAFPVPNPQDFAGDAGSGGSRGLVPSPAAGDAAADKVLSADGSWTPMGVLTQDDKEKTPVATIGNFQDTTCAITNTPKADGYVRVDVNGVPANLGDGIVTKDCYFGLPGQISGYYAFTKLAHFADHTVALASNGTIWTWGINGAGQLGDQSVTTRSSPISVVGNHSFIAVAGGSQHSKAIKADGTAWSWGLGTTIGDNQTAANRSSPVSVVGNHSFIAIECGSSFTLALKADGTAWAWGVNTNGNLGDNSTSSRSSPTSVAGGHSFVAISCGGYLSNFTSYALKADGTAWAWGANTSGRLGDNTATSRSVPTSVVGNHSFIAIVGGGFHAVALKADGTVWCWGEATFGKLGDNQITAHRSSPVSVVGNHSFVQISAAAWITSARKENGEFWAWGDKDFGKIGDNQTSADRSSPVTAVGNHSFIYTTNGAEQSFGIKSNGSLWTWGLGTNGQMGENNNVSRSSPVSVIGTGNPAVPKTISNIEAGDTLYWNGGVAGYDLLTNDRINFNYIM